MIMNIENLTPKIVNIALKLKECDFSEVGLHLLAGKRGKGVRNLYERPIDHVQVVKEHEDSSCNSQDIVAVVHLNLNVQHSFDAPPCMVPRLASWWYLSVDVIRAQKS